MAAHGVRFKAEDIWDAPDDHNRYEVIDGELYATPSPGWKHQNAVGKLYWRLANWIFPRDLGRIVPAPTGVVLDAETAVEPDIVYLSNDRLHLISDRGVEGPPDLVVEVLSPSTQARDRGIKMRRYAAAGIPHYWVLDVHTPALEVYRRGAQDYELEGRHGAGAVFRPDLFPGLEIPVDDLWG